MDTGIQLYIIQKNNTEGRFPSSEIVVLPEKKNGISILKIKNFAQSKLL